jgi:hypothetical protein
MPGIPFNSFMKNLEDWLNNTKHFVDVVIVSNQSDGEVLLFFGRAYGKMTSGFLDDLKFLSDGGVFSVNKDTGNNYLDSMSYSRFVLGTSHMTNPPTPGGILTIYADAEHTQPTEEVTIENIRIMGGDMLSGSGRRANGKVAPCVISFQKRKVGGVPALRGE